MEDLEDMRLEALEKKKKKKRRLSDDWSTAGNLRITVDQDYLQIMDSVTDHCLFVWQFI